jgi:hypothetical protein
MIGRGSDTDAVLMEPPCEISLSASPDFHTSYRCGTMTHHLVVDLHVLVKKHRYAASCDATLNTRFRI